MYANQSFLYSSELQGTVQALRALRSDITRTLARLEPGLAEDKPRRPSLAPRMNEAGYTLFGQTFRVSNGSEILVDILRHFAEFDPSFPGRYCEAVRDLGRKRPYVARAREALYPGKPRLLPQTAQFAPGWFVGTNEGNDKKLKLLRIACNVLDLCWNQDLVVRMP